MSLVCLADVAIGGTGTKLRPAYPSIGFTPDGGMSWTLPRIVGAARAREILLNDDRWRRSRPPGDSHATRRRRRGSGRSSSPRPRLGQRAEHVVLGNQSAAAFVTDELACRATRRRSCVHRPRGEQPDRPRRCRRIRRKASPRFHFREAGVSQRHAERRATTFGMPGECRRSSISPDSSRPDRLPVRSRVRSHD